MKTVWTEEDLACLWAHYKEPNGPANITRETGHSYREIVSMAQRVGLRREKKKYTVKGVLKFYTPPPDLSEKLLAGKCPGKFAYCGKTLWTEIVMDEGGCSTDLRDMVCEVGHRFPIPKNGIGG